MKEGLEKRMKNVNDSKRRDSRRSRKRKGRRRSKEMLFLSSLLMCLLLVVLFLFSYYYLEMGSLYFLKDTTINGVDFSEKNALDAVSELEEIYNVKEIALEEQGEVVYTGILSEIGYQVDSVLLLEEVEELLEHQKKSMLETLLGKRDYTISIPFKVDQAVFTEAVKVDKLSKERYPSEDARLSYNGENYEIIAEIYGNEIEDAMLQAWVSEHMDAALKKINESEAAKIELTEELYIQPVIFEYDELLIDKMTVFNKYCNSEITYQFGKQEQVLGWDTIQNWILINDGEGGISEEAVTNYVIGLEAQYNTIYKTRTITTSHGFDVTLPTNDYGYRIDEAGEINQLIADISSNTPVTREPVYEISGYQRDGVDDVAGTYIEIDLTEQLLWFYKDNELVVKTAIVSGMPKIQETSTGAFPIAYKAGPYNLVGGGTDGVDSWDVEVQYWMPFHDGQGLHDASWRAEGTFGGGMYLYNGSHGCVNLPTEKAKIIFENAEAGMPIFLYKTAEIPEEYLPEEEESESEPEE